MGLADVTPASASAHTLTLQVRSRSGDYIDVPVVPGAILVNVADLMQRWTSDRFISAVSIVVVVALVRPSPQKTPVRYNGAAPAPTPPTSPSV